MSENTFTKIYEVVKKIPKGQVATYGQVARLAGNKRWSRLWVMHFTQTMTLKIYLATGELIEMEMCLKHLHLVARTDNWLI